jgi:hypothetical protein
MEMTLDIQVKISEDDRHTMAYATLDLRGDHFEALGRARRNPEDPPMPVVGEELALARALHDLTGQVMDAAQTKIDRFLSDD